MELSSEGQRAKARLVVIGFEDPGIDTVANDAPTLTKDGRMAVLQTISSNRWELTSFDISAAFLHGKGDGRPLGLHPPPELKLWGWKKGTSVLWMEGLTVASMLHIFGIVSFGMNWSDKDVPNAL